MPILDHQHLILRLHRHRRIKPHPLLQRPAPLPISRSYPRRGPIQILNRGKHIIKILDAVLWVQPVRVHVLVLCVNADVESHFSFAAVHGFDVEELDPVLARPDFLVFVYVRRDSVAEVLDGGEVGGFAGVGEVFRLDAAGYVCRAVVCGGKAGDEEKKTEG